MSFFSKQFWHKLMTSSKQKNVSQFAHFFQHFRSLFLKHEPHLPTFRLLICVSLASSSSESLVTIGSSSLYNSSHKVWNHFWSFSLAVRFYLTIIKIEKTLSNKNNKKKNNKKLCNNNDPSRYLRHMINCLIRFSFSSLFSP